MARLSGVPREDLDAAGEKLAAEVVEALHEVAGMVAARLGVVITAALADPTEPEGPGEPYVSPDDLGVIRTEWAARVAGRLLAFVAELYERAVLALAVGLSEALPEGAREAYALPAVSNDAAEAYLAGARNRLIGIGDDLWMRAREQLLEGFAQGESIPKLRDRVRSAAGLSEARATNIARTEVLGASSAGAYDQMVALGLPTLKGWLDAGDPRVRPTHRDVRGVPGPDGVAAKMIPLDAPFAVGGALMQRPHDPAGPVGEIAGCRCTNVFEITEDAMPTPAPGPAALAAAADPHDGAMIALVPSDADLDRLALDVPGALPRDELHLTLLFLGENAAIDQTTRERIIDAVRRMVDERGYGPIEAEAFAPAMFNPNGDEPCWVLVIGRTDEIGVAREAMGEAFEGNALGFMPPEQHTPYIPHTTIAYTDDPGLAATLAPLTGPISYDRLRVSFGTLEIDIPLAGGVAAAAAPPGGDQAMPWRILTDLADCPDGYAVVDAEGDIVPGGCHETKEEAQAQVEALYASEGEGEGGGEGTVVGETMAGEHWHSVMIVEGVSTGFRTFAEGSLSWREPPFALRWQVTEPEMGGHANSVHVGNVTRVERRGAELHAWGPLDLRDYAASEFARKLAEGFAPWVSIGLDESSRESDIEYVFPEGTEEDPQPEDPEGDEPGVEVLLGPEPEQMIFHRGVIAELTAVTVPAQAEAFIEALPALRDALVEAGVIAPEAVATALAAAGDVAPPASWFSDPGLDEPTPITVDDDGRVRGHAALHGTCHVGVLGECVTPPAEDEYGHFMTGELVTASGERVAVGQITLGTGHAPLHLAARPAAEHYDHTGTAVADVSVGRDAHGIWVAGAIRPGVEPSRVAELRASGQVSGDWRRIGGRLRLVGLLAVNVPGFPVPKMRARVAAGVPRALVAAGALPPSPAVVSALALDDATRALRGAAERIARTVGRDRASRRRDLVARVRAGR